MATFYERINLLYDEAKDRNHRIGRKAYAEMLDVTLGQVNGWIDGLGRPDPDTLKKIAKISNVSTSWLVGETEFRNLDIPENCDMLPDAAQMEYKMLLDYLKFKYGIKKT